MNCPRCGNERSRIIYTRPDAHGGEAIYRRRECRIENCRATWRTWERNDPSDPNPGRRRHSGEPRNTLPRQRRDPGDIVQNAQLLDPLHPNLTHQVTVPKSEALQAFEQLDEILADANTKVEDEPPIGWQKEFGKRVRDS